MDGAQLQRMAAAFPFASNTPKKYFLIFADSKWAGSEGEPVEFRYGTFIQNDSNYSWCNFVV